MELNQNESSGIEVLLEEDIVWGKAFPHTWWPVLIKKIDHCGILISFYGCKMTRYCDESEICSFEKNFRDMTNKMEGSLFAAVQCALVDLCRRVARGLSCPCRDSLEGEKSRHPTKQMIQVKKSFQPRVVLDFILRMAISTWVEHGEELMVTRQFTEVNAFRRHSYIRKDRIYQETMRLSERCSAYDDSEVTINDDVTMALVPEESDFSKDQETKHDVIPQKAESDLAICSMNMEDFSALDSDEELESPCENQAIYRMNMVDSGARGSDNEFETLCEDQAICTVSMVDFSVIDSYENQVEDVNMLSLSIDDGFVFVEEGFEVQNSRGVYARGQINVEEMKKGRSGTDFCLDNGPMSAFCGTNKEKKPSCRGNFRGHSDGLGLESFPARTSETIEPQEGSITGVCREYKLDDSEKSLATLTPKKMDGNSAILDGPETIFLKTEFVDCFDLNSDHDKTIDSDPLLKSCKNQPFLADASFRDASTVVETQLSNDYHPVEPPVRSWAQNYQNYLYEDRKQPLLEILTHLHCLALDPFYFSARSKEYQAILKYRNLVYHNICNIYPVTHICDHVREFGKLREISLLDSTAQQYDLAPEMQTEVQLFSHNQEGAYKNAHACTGEITEACGENVKVFSSYMPEIDAVKPVSKEALPATEPMSKDSVGKCLLIGKASEKTGESQLLSSCTDDVHSCDTAGATSNITSKSESLSCKIQPFSADASFRDANTVVETQLSNDYHPVEPPVRSWAQNYLSEDRKQPLLEILTHLHCLALDPFYFSARSKEYQVILKYRNLVYHNICTIYPVTHICDHVREFGKLREISQLDSTPQQCDLAPEMQTEVQLFSHNQESAYKNAHACTGEITEGCGENVKVFLSYMPEIDAVKPVSKEELPTTELMSKDPVGKCLLIGKASEKTGVSQLLSSCNDDVHSCDTAGATSNITSKSESLRTISKNSCLSKRKHGCPVPSDSSLELVSSHIIFPLNKMYASPLSMDTPVLKNNLLCQSSEDHYEGPTSLHMKFPRNFNIPSKVELITKFRPFGPVDYLRTRIFLYSGAAQVVFLHRLDAVAAYRFSKRRSLFGQTIVLFWLDRHEHSRRKTNMPAQLSLSGVGTSALNLKSCLKKSNPYGKSSNKGKGLRVKFMPEKNVSAATTISGKNTPFTDSDSPCNVWENRRPDISQQMLMLLEECNQLVCQIKDGFGLQSYYSMFTHTLGYEMKLLS
ncbi:hypothetical protein NE237_004930 [Protea cynaroides]|uniref:PWWP domain-containing protein n=1 Tax=Protea cynaroides TaxID=273540 RepID=A0A9Q0KJV5_9MAGN|nr:hypothetical protein NE237_004930 [Protea cynaroides]